MIYRVIASSTAPDWKDREAMERVVFFEASTRTEAHQHLKELLSALWVVSPETIEYYNLDDEVEMISYSVGGEASGDHRFFESGMAHGQPMYVGGLGHPLMLLHRNLDRMMAAYFTLPHRGEAGLRVHLGKFD